MQTNGRVKVKAFLPKQNRNKLAFQGEKPLPFTEMSYEDKKAHIDNDLALRKFQEKFYG